MQSLQKKHLVKLLETIHELSKHCYQQLKRKQKNHLLIKGTLADGTPQESDKYAVGSREGSSEGFGLLYPDLGLIILNPYALACEFGTKIETWYDEWYTTTSLTSIHRGKNSDVLLLGMGS